MDWLGVGNSNLILSDEQINGRYGQMFQANEAVAQKHQMDSYRNLNHCLKVKGDVEIRREKG